MITTWITSVAWNITRRYTSHKILPSGDDNYMDNFCSPEHHPALYISQNFTPPEMITTWITSVARNITRRYTSHKISPSGDDNYLDNIRSPEHHPTLYISQNITLRR
jgi:hypothetical protein